jgi:hypothetical protein
MILHVHVFGFEIGYSGFWRECYYLGVCMRWHLFHTTIWKGAFSDSLVECKYFSFSMAAFQGLLPIQVLCTLFWLLRCANQVIRCMHGINASIYSGESTRCVVGVCFMRPFDGPVAFSVMVVVAVK